MEDIRFLTKGGNNMTEKITVSKAWILMAAQSVIEGADGSDLRHVLDEEDIKILIDAQKVARKAVNLVQDKDSYFDVEIPCKD